MYYGLILLSVIIFGGVMIISTLLCFFGPKKPSRRELLSVLIGFAGMLALFLIQR